MEKLHSFFLSAISQRNVIMEGILIRDSKW